MPPKPKHEAEGLDFKIEPALKQFLVTDRTIMRDGNGDLVWGEDEFRVYVAEGCPGIEDCEARVFLPRVHVLKRDPFLKSATIYLQEQAEKSAEGDAIPIPDGGEMIIDVLGEHAALFKRQTVAEEGLEGCTRDISTDVALYAATTKTVRSILRMDDYKGRSIVSVIMRGSLPPKEVVERVKKSEALPATVPPPTRERERSPRREKSRRRERSPSRDRRRQRERSPSRELRHPRRQPPRAPQQPVKFPALRCAKCGGMGHDDGKTPVGVRCPPKLGNNPCDRCMGVGHFARVCPSPTV